MELSIIIPVYNTIEYLSRCVESVIKNIGIDKEIILVDDGSTDGSGKLCDTYSSRYHNIKTIHIKNSGPASAKNRGLDIATGKYVAMIDSDDEVEPQMFVKMLEEAKMNEADIVCCNYKERLPNGEMKLFDYTEKTYLFDNYLGIRNFLMKEKIHTQCWTKIYRRDLIEQNNIRNIEGLKTDEDFIFNINCFVHSSKTCVIDSPLYIYTIRETSLSKDYFNKDINAYIDNRLLHFDIVDKLIDEYAPKNKEHAIFSRLYYSNELLGRIALFPNHFKDRRTKKVINYMRCHILYALSVHHRIGFSLVGCLMLLLPASLYMGYRHRKICN